MNFLNFFDSRALLSYKELSNKNIMLSVILKFGVLLFEDQDYSLQLRVVNFLTNYNFLGPIHSQIVAISFKIAFKK